MKGGCWLEALGLGCPEEPWERELGVEKRGQAERKSVRDRWKNLGSNLGLNWTSVSPGWTDQQFQALLKEHRCDIGKGTREKKKNF